MNVKLNERTLALLAARSVPNQLTYLAMTVKLNERTLALLVARSSSKYSVYILTLKTAFSARICAEYLNRRRQMLFLLSFTVVAILVYWFEMCDCIHCNFLVIKSVFGIFIYVIFEFFRVVIDYEFIRKVYFFNNWFDASIVCNVIHVVSVATTYHRYIIFH